jgi:hypothetical protein
MCLPTKGPPTIFTKMIKCSAKELKYILFHLVWVYSKMENKIVFFAEDCPLVERRLLMNWLWIHETIVICITRPETVILQGLFLVAGYTKNFRPHKQKKYIFLNSTAYGNLFFFHWQHRPLRKMIKISNFKIKS